MLLFLSLSTELFLGHREERTPADPSKRGQDALIPEASALCRDQMHKTNHLSISFGEGRKVLTVI